MPELTFQNPVFAAYAIAAALMALKLMGQAWITVAQLAMGDETKAVEALARAIELDDGGLAPRKNVEALQALLAHLTAAQRERLRQPLCLG